MNTRITDKKEKTVTDDMTKILFTQPNTFRKDDPERVAIFRERLKSVRMLREKQSKTDDKIIRKDWSQESIGTALGISTAGYGKYENNIKTIPWKNIAKLCDIFDVTPHYLLGYSQQEDCVVELDGEGNIVMKDGKPNELHYAFQLPSAIQSEALDMYRNLINSDPMLFSLISKLMQAPERKKKVCITVLSALLDWFVKNDDIQSV